MMSESSPEYQRGDDREVIPVVVEAARIEKQTVETGRTLFHKSVTERDETVDALLARSDVSVERIAHGRVVRGSRRRRFAQPGAARLH